jgi:hypothetical protein
MLQIIQKTQMSFLGVHRLKSVQDQVDPSERLILSDLLTMLMPPREPFPLPLQHVARVIGVRLDIHRETPSSSASMG